MAGIPIELPEKASLAFKRFLTPLVGTSKVHAKVVDLMAMRTALAAERKGEEGTGSSNHAAQLKARKAANQALWRLTGSKEDVLKPYPTRETVEEIAHALRAEHPWAWSPVLFYASGWLEPLVQVTAMVNVRKLTPDKLVKLLESIPECVSGDPSARELWTLTGTECEAFPALEDALGQLEGRPLGDDDLAVALALSKHYELRYDLYRDRVLGSLIAWAERAAGIRDQKTRLRLA